MEIKFSPKMLLSMKAAHHKWPVILGELIDNSLDAQATSVELAFTPGKFSISDNGNGCQSIDPMFEFGFSFDKGKDALGRYGIGLKEAATSLWGVMKIVTTRNGVTQTAEIKWDAVIDNDNLTIPDPISTPALAGEIGTKLTFKDYEPKPPASFDAIIKDISYLYSPSLRGGKCISICHGRQKRVSLSAYEMPDMVEVVEDTICIEGRTARIRVGIVRDARLNLHPGITFCYSYRVVKRSSDIGEYSARLIAGEVILDNQWTLNKTKDDFVGSDELSEAIFDRCEALFKKSDAQAMNISSAAIAAKLTDSFQAIQKALGHNLKEKRDSRRNESGAISPVGSARKRLNVSKTQAGNGALSSNRVGAIRVEWRSFDRETIGEVEIHASRIWMNENNRYLNEIKSNHDALLNMCVCLYVEAALSCDGTQKYLPGMENKAPDGTFGQYMAAILETVKMAQASASYVAQPKRKLAAV